MKTYIKLMALVSCVLITSVPSKTLPGGYKTIESLGTSQSINTHYTGTIWATGGAIADMNKYIRKMDPTNIGTLKPNQLTIHGDTTHKKETYSFKKVKCYKVSLNNDTFTVYSLKAKKENQKYHIIIELREGPHYDRIINIHKNKKPYMLILWKDNILIKPLKKTKI